MTTNATTEAATPTETTAEARPCRIYSSTVCKHPGSEQCRPDCDRQVTREKCQARTKSAEGPQEPLKRKQRSRTQEPSRTSRTSKTSRTAREDEPTKIGDVLPKAPSKTEARMSDADREAKAKQIAGWVLDGFNDDHQGVPGLRETSWHAGRYVSKIYLAYLAGRAVAAGYMDLQGELMPIIAYITRNRAKIKAPPAYFWKSIRSAIGGKPGGKQWLAEIKSKSKKASLDAKAERRAG